MIAFLAVERSLKLLMRLHHRKKEVKTFRRLVLVLTEIPL